MHTAEPSPGEWEIGSLFGHVATTGSYGHSVQRRMVYGKGVDCVDAAAKWDTFTPFGIAGHIELAGVQSSICHYWKSGVKLIACWRTQ